MVMYHFCYLVPQVAYEGGNDTLLIGPRLVSNGLLLVYEGFMVLFRVLVVLIVTPCVPVLVFIPMVIIGLEPSGVLFEAVEIEENVRGGVTFGPDNFKKLVLLRCHVMLNDFFTK